MSQTERSTATAAVRCGIESDTQFGAVVPPLHLSSNFAFDGFGNKRQYDYTRSGNPTRDTLADALTELEGGAGATITSTGMSAIVLATHLLNADDLLIAPHDCYGGSYRAFSSLAAKGHFRVQFVDLTDESARNAAFLQRPTLVWVETPSNPLLRITDVGAVAERCREVGALLAVDNTFLSPLWQRPFELGADLVIHSTTKYLNGHSDVVGGAVVAATDELHEQISWWANCLGVTGAPFDSYLTLRGIRTLKARLRLHEENCRAVVDLLCTHDAVSRVYYPGLQNHPGHEIAARQQRSFGAMVSFELDGGEEEAAAFLNGLRHFSLAESLGGVESLVAHPAGMTHAAMSEEARATAGIAPSLLRLSVGIEDAEDLLNDLRSGLDRALDRRRNLATFAGRASAVA